MRINIHKNGQWDRVSIEEFSDVHGLSIDVHERPPKSGLPRFYASFSEGVEQKEGDMLCSSSGNGDTIDDAIEDYAKRISGKLLVIGAYTDRRKEIRSPQLYYKAED